VDDISAYAGLFFAALLAATLIPASSEVALGVMVASGTGDLIWLFLVATVGNVLGSVINWLFGRFLAEFRDRKWFPVDGESYDKAAHAFRRWGVWSLLFAWVPIIGDPLTVVAGALRIGFARFLTLVTLGKATRYFVVLAAADAWVG
jgi:membrane protein YqaA with SNARE-associated domain